MADKTPVITKANLAELPEELISNISIKLDADDIFAFRLSCKPLESKSFHEFANEYFQQKGFIFTSESLKVLLNIAQSDKLRGYLHAVYFIPAVFCEQLPECPHGCTCPFRMNVRHREAYRFYASDQQMLRQSGMGLDMMLQAFNGLTDLHQVGFVHFKENEATNDVNICGFSRSARRTNTSPIIAPGGAEEVQYYRHKNYLWKTLMRAIAQSSLTTLTDLRTSLDCKTNSLTVQDNLMLPLRTLGGLAECFQGLKDLTLEISSRRLTARADKVAGDDDDSNLVKRVGTMSTWARMMTSLEGLALSFSYSPSSSILYNGFMAHIDLTKLTALYLSHMWTDAEALGVTLCSLVAVNDLRLTWVNLAEGHWVPILQAIQNLTKLNHLHLMYLHEAERKVYFLAQPEQDELGQGDEYEPLHEAFNPPDSDLGTADHTVPSCRYGHPGDRGRYVCIEGAQIQEQLPTFIKECNVPDDEADGGMNMNALLNNMAAALGVPAANATNVTGNAQAGAATFTVPATMPLPGQGAGPLGGLSVGQNGGPAPAGAGATAATQNGQGGSAQANAGAANQPAAGATVGGQNGYGAGGFQWQSLGPFGMLGFGLAGGLPMPQPAGGQAAAANNAGAAGAGNGTGTSQLGTGGGQPDVEDDGEWTDDE